MEDRTIGLLVQKEAEIQELLDVWAKQNDIVDESQRIEFGIRVVKIPLVLDDNIAFPSNHTPRHQLQLPCDTVNQFGFSEKFHLSEENWLKILHLPLDEGQTKIINLFRRSNNGPIHRSAFAQNCGLTWGSKETRRINDLLKAYGNLDKGNRKGYYYKLALLISAPYLRQFYVIAKHGYE
jgi:hypothetical protein